MPHSRFYLDGSTTLTGDEFAHLKVTRPQVGDTIELVDGRGTLSAAKIVNVGKRDAELSIISSIVGEPEPPLILMQAIPRGNRLDTIVEKGTELGATAFWLFPGERSEKQRVSLDRLTRLAISAMKQSGRLYLPEILMKPPLLEWTELPTPACFGDLRAKKRPTPGAHIVIGPEAGLSDKEISHLEKLGAEGVSLHRNVLRADTAAIVGLALVCAVD